jgi:uncharacterized membrane protein
MSLFIDFLFRWFHVLFGLVWVGLLYYFNFVQGEYFKEASDDARADVMGKLVPRALLWFRYAALATFFTGLYLLAALGAGANQYILLGALMGTLMFINVWLIIWPCQKVLCGLAEGDKARAAPRALLASRTNTLFSAPMLYGMLASKHGPAGGGYDSMAMSDIGWVLAVVIVLALQVNAVIGKIWKMASIVGVIHLSLALTFVLYALLHFL